MKRPALQTLWGDLPDIFGEPASNVEDFLGSFLLLRKSASGWRLMFIVKRMAYKWVA
jgi:hypothetical protein